MYIINYIDTAKICFCDYIFFPADKQLSPLSSLWASVFNENYESFHLFRHLKMMILKLLKAYCILTYAKGNRNCHETFRKMHLIIPAWRKIVFFVYYLRASHQREFLIAGNTYFACIMQCVQGAIVYCALVYIVWRNVESVIIPIKCNHISETLASPAVVDYLNFYDSNTVAI